MQAGRWHVLEQSVEKLDGCEGHDGGLRLAVGSEIPVVAVTEGDVLIVEGQDLGALDGAAAGVAGEVGGEALGVGVRRLDARGPALAPGGLEPALAILRAGVLRQEEIPGGEKPRKLGTEPLPELVPQLPAGEEKAAYDRPPLAFWSESSGRDEEVQMGMEHESATPGMERRDDARNGAAQPAGLCHQLEHGTPGHREEKLGEGGAVPQPEQPQLGRQGEHDLVVVAGEQALALPGEPLLDLGVGALRAGAVPAGVVPDPFDVAFRACPGVASEGRGAAPPQSQNGPTKVGRQPPALEVTVQGHGEDGLNRALHTWNRTQSRCGI